MPQLPAQARATTTAAGARPDSGGPAADNGSIALPKRKDQPEDTPPPAPAAPKFKNPEGAGNYSMRVDVQEVTVDVGVLLEKTHQFVPNLKPANFRVYEDGVEQKIEGFKRVEAPITALMLCEFAATVTGGGRGRTCSTPPGPSRSSFVRRTTWRMMTYDMRTQIVTDFTQDKRQSAGRRCRLCRSPAFSETNVFDALYEAGPAVAH